MGRSYTPEQKAAMAENLRKAREAKKQAAAKLEADANEAKKVTKEESEQADAYIEEVVKQAEKTAVEEAKKQAAAAEEEKPQKTTKKSSANSNSGSAKDDTIAQLQEQIRKLQEQMLLMARPAPVYVSSNSEKVNFLWLAEVADDNVVSFGEGGMYGRIVGKVGTFFVPKDELSRLLDRATRRYLEKRWLIITSGLDADEMEALGCTYEEGELLDRKAFSRMVEMGEQILEVYPLLCDGHKDMVEKRFYEAYRANSLYIKRNIITELNKLAKAAGKEDNAFITILQEMNEAEAR